jgi:hypothetical protein
MRCIDCGTECRNRCNKCNKGYCANCRDAARSKTCKQCRDAQKAARQQSRSKQQQSQQVQTAAYTPPPHLAQFVQPQVALPSRPDIYLMDDATFKAWQTKILDGLEDAQARGAAYLARRRARGVQTSTDLAMERDQLLFADLIEALKELPTLRAWAEDNQTGQHQSHNTGFMLPYDDKVKP